MDPEDFEKKMEKTVEKYFLQQIKHGVIPPVLVQALLRCAYATLDSAAQDNQHNLPWAFRKLVDQTASMFENEK